MPYRDFDDALGLRPAEAAAPSLDWDRHPVIAVINILAVAVMEVLGPFCWMALILLFLVAVFSPG
jgi:hypothetical protein